MAHERRRAALAALCVFAVAVAATLLPASGFGSQPAGVGIGGGGHDAPPGGGGPDVDPQPTATSSPTVATSDGDTTTPGRGDTTTTTTTATTTTAAGESDAGGGGGGDLLGAVLLAVLALGGGLAVAGFWTGVLAVNAAGGALPFTITVGGTPIGDLFGSVPTRTMSLVVGLSAAVPRLLDDAAALTGAVGGGLASVLGAAGRGTADALRIGAQGLAATFAAVPRALAGLGAGAGVFASLGSVSVPSFGGRSRGTDSGNAGGPGANDPEDVRPPTVEEAWQALRDRVPVRNRRARTPGEVARTAVRRGYPDEAVRRLTDAFREVRYGDLPRDARTDSARSALDRLRDYWGDDE